MIKLHNFKPYFLYDRLLVWCTWSRDMAQSGQFLVVPINSSFTPNVQQLCITNIRESLKKEPYSTLRN